jgi:hypothetical protein
VLCQAENRGNASLFGDGIIGSGVSQGEIADFVELGLAFSRIMLNMGPH